MTVDAAAVALRVREVRQRIVAAGGRIDGPGAVRLVAVTKTFGADAIAAAVRAGCDAVGENYAQELVAKLADLDALLPEGAARPEVHFIGQLQTNKVRQLVGRVDVWQSVDRPSLVAELAKRAPGARILVQVDATGEPGKGGCPAADVEALVASAVAAGLDVRGLMTVGPTEGGPEAARPAFALTRSLADRLGLVECSMGMTHDLEVGVQEGATMVRVGTALFGDRARPPAA